MSHWTSTISVSWDLTWRHANIRTALSHFSTQYRIFGPLFLPRLLLERVIWIQLMPENAWLLLILSTVSRKTTLNAFEERIRTFIVYSSALSPPLLLSLCVCLLLGCSGGQLSPKKKGWTNTGWAWFHCGYGLQLITNWDQDQEDCKRQCPVSEVFSKGIQIPMWLRITQSIGGAVIKAEFSWHRLDGMCLHFYLHTFAQSLLFPQNGEGTNLLSGYWWSPKC